MVAAELPVADRAVAGTGGAAVVGAGGDDAGGAAPVAVRAELDGLPMREQTGSEFSATGAAMHACGHDVHMAALVALARAAHRLGDELPAPLLALFQPSEEAYPSGAEQLARGELAGSRPPRCVAAHVHPELPWGSVGLDAGVVNASCDAVEITIEGRPTHGAYPHLGRDPILALAQVVVSLHAQVGRRIDPLGAAVADGRDDRGRQRRERDPRRGARARRAARLQPRSTGEILRELVEQVSEGVAAAHGCTAARRAHGRGAPARERRRDRVAGARR